VGSLEECAYQVIVVLHVTLANAADYDIAQRLIGFLGEQGFHGRLVDKRDGTWNIWIEGRQEPDGLYREWVDEEVDSARARSLGSGDATSLRDVADVDGPGGSDAGGTLFG
jgi:hypothetical protein